jgi:hypothetical protein
LAFEFVECHYGDSLPVPVQSRHCIMQYMHAGICYACLMKAGATDRVREFVRREYIDPARKRGEHRVRILAGDVHRALGLHNRIPLVCSALRSGEFLRRNHLRIESQDGPPSLMSTTVTFTYVLEDPAGRQATQSSLYQLRGIAKQAFQELGGGEAFLRAERRQFDASTPDNP